MSLLLSSAWHNVTLNVMCVLKVSLLVSSVMKQCHSQCHRCYETISLLMLCHETMSLLMPSMSWTVPLLVICFMTQVIVRVTLFYDPDDIVLRHRWHQEWHCLMTQVTLRVKLFPVTDDIESDIVSWYMTIKVSLFMTQTALRMALFHDTDY